MNVLRPTARRLLETAQAVEADIRARADKFGTDPALLMDSSGRYLMLDAQAAQMQALTVLDAD